MKRPSEMPPDEWYLPLSGWLLRVGRGSRGRPALEIYTPDGLMDVAVAGLAATALLRGAMYGRTGRRKWSLAWGHLPPGGQVTVEFRSRTRTEPAAHRVIADRFWVAEIPGFQSTVTLVNGEIATAVHLRRHHSRRSQSLR
ncbi:MAG: hypothetical protein JWN00_1070 [Actinomycetia bacterium]|nr:hypothetical protein [Actinomycetes bacterium]